MPDVNASGEQVSQILRDWSEIRLLEAVLTVAAGFAVALAIKWLVPRVAEQVPGRFRFWVLPLTPIVRALVWLFVLAYIVPLFIHPTPENLLAISGALALALGFAFKDYASSLIAGVVALYEQPYRNGDWVQIEETYGEVQALNLRTVQILTPDDTVVAVPHSKIWDTAIYNSNSGHRELMCVADFYLHPNHDGHEVRQKLIDAALASPYVHLRRPILVVAAEKPWGTHYRLKAYPIEGREQFLFLTDLTIRGKALLRGSQMESPAVSVGVEG
ncbi:MAG: mechanosensitive ion channel [Planctomycetales bacterium]|nr:mechanosensitive ion channel [Planctomycetales bacterium]